MSKLAADWFLEPGQESVWIAEIENEYLPEPHGYGRSIEFTGEAAKELIEELQELNGQDFLDRLREILG